MSEMNPSPLPADPTRQAWAMLSACEYQILQTVNAWLDLRSTDALYVEGAEDFDVASLDGTEAVQVKTSPDPISLGQRGIQKAISQFWDLKTRATGRNVQFKYLTRAPYTVERSKPFGEDVAGIELWQRRSISKEEIRRVRDFLLEQPAIEETLKRWLRSVTEEEIGSQLLKSISWETLADDFSGVERSVWCKLSAFANHRERVSASVLKRIARRLKEEVWTCLRQPGQRRLDHFRLEELWEEETFVSIPHSAMVARLSMPPSGQPVDRQDSTRLLRVGPPPLPGIVVHRDLLVNSLREILAGSGVLLLHGSSRMGKTTLAKLIAVSQGDSWRWYTFRGYRADEARRAIEKLAREIAFDSEVVDLVLDDLDLSAGTSFQAEEALGEIVALVKGRRGRLLITSQRELSGTLAHSNGIEAGQIVSVPRLKLQEVIDLTGSLGCPEPEQCSTWGKIVHASTAGHPQLAAARLLALRQGGWPTATSKALDSGTQAVEAERSEALQVLTNTLDEPGRAMLIRLSSFPFSFRREHGIELGAVPPPIGFPGGELDALVGPWIEPLHKGYYALSPLLTNLAERTLPSNDFRRLQNDAAHTLLQCKPCSQEDFGQAFFLLWQTRNEAALAKLVEILLGSDEELASALAEELWWFTLIATRPGQRLYQESASLSLLLRPLQLRIASRRTPEQVGPLVEAWRWELENVEHAEPVLMRVTFAMFVLINTDIRVPASDVIRALADVRDAVNAYPEMPFPTTTPKGDRNEFDYMPDWDDPVAALSFTCSAHCVDLTFFEELLIGLEGVEPGLRERILKGFVCSGLEIQMALDRVWLTESEKDEPDWEHCLRVFQKGRTLGLDWSCPWLATSSMKACIVVLDEYLHDYSRAHTVLDEMEAPGDLIIHTVHDRRACIYFSEGNYKSAEEEWRKAMQQWPNARAPFDSHSAYAARSGGIAAARQSRWIQAADWFRLSIARLPNDDRPAYVAGCQAEAGYCLWVAGQKRQAIACLIEAWRLADTLAIGREDPRAFVTRKTIAHVIAWIHGKETGFGVGEMHEPVAGICSSLELPEKALELPETESGSVWLFLIRLERALSAGNRAAELGSKSVSSATNPITVWMAALEELTRCLSSSEVVNLPVAVIRMHRALLDAASKTLSTPADAVTECDPEEFNAGDPVVGRMVFLAGLIGANDQGMHWKEALDGWRSSLPGGGKGDWKTWFDDMERILGASKAESARIVRSSGGGAHFSAVAAWHLLISNGVSPEDVFASHARLLALGKAFYWLQTVGDAFCRQVKAKWKEVSSCPALLRQPRISVPAIAQASSDGDEGLGQAARILLAASQAVTTRTDREMMDVITELAGTRTRH